MTSFLCDNYQDKVLSCLSLYEDRLSIYKEAVMNKVKEVNDNVIIDKYKNVFGFIDGTHIPIVKPQPRRQNNVYQGLCLPDGLIIVDEIYSGDGRNDLTLWRDGSIKEYLDRLNLIRITDDVEPYHVLGDGIYYDDYVSMVSLHSRHNLTLQELQENDVMRHVR